VPLQAINVALSSYDSNDFDAVLDRAEENYVVSLREAATVAETVRLTCLSNIRILRQNLASRFDLIHPIVRCDGFVARNKLGMLVQVLSSGS
jgi:hypothetical protein